MKRALTRRTFAGTIRPLAVDEGAFEIEARRGCFRRQIDKHGDVVLDDREVTRSLRSEIGDRLVVSNANLAVDEIAVVRVAMVIPDGHREKHAVRIVKGRISIAPHDVYVQPLKTSRPAAPRRRRARKEPLL